MNVRKRLVWRAEIATDIGLGVVFAAALAFEAFQVAGSWGGGYWQFGLAAGAVVCTVALVRRRNRARAAATGLSIAAAAILVAWFAHLPSEPGLAMILSLSVLVGSALRVLPTRPACAVAAGGLAVVVGSLLAALTSSSSTAGVGLNGMGWLAALTIGLGMRGLDARRRDLAEKARRDERLELARELHDAVAHHITGIVIEAQAGQIDARKHPEKVESSFSGIEAAGSDALAAMRRVIGLLRDADGAALTTPGIEQLSDLVERFDGHGAVVRLRLPDDEWAGPPEVASTVYRIVQESLTNIANHAPHARSVTVDVTQDREREVVTVEVVDDAPPGPIRYHHRGGYGLVGMRERVEALDGTLRVGPRPGTGWSVVATLPTTGRRERR